MTNSLNENDCRIVNSRGILKSCDIHSGTPVSSIKVFIDYHWEGLRPGSTVYVCTSAIGQLAHHLERIPCPIVLVSGDADEDAPTQIFASELDFHTFIESPKIIHWFAQNCAVKHPKLSSIPIGLDYHTMTRAGNIFKKLSTPDEQEKLIQEILNNAPILTKRIFKCYSNFHFVMTLADRKRLRSNALPKEISIQTSVLAADDRVRAKELISADLIDYEPTPVDRETTWRNQSNYAFVISPHGNGLDCHRTWEALCLGCIPIVKTSPLDSLYEELPVYIVQDWSEVTEENLRKVLHEFSQRKFDLNRLTLKYWMDIINSKKIP
jgi:hypothetical protein